MEAQDNWITAVIFEHACKENFKTVTKRMLEDPDLSTKITENTLNSESVTLQKPRVQPVYLFVSLLKQMNSLEDFGFNTASSPSINVLPTMLELLESTYKQFNFMSLRRYFTLTSELKLLDLLNLIVENSESSLVVQKLNQHFPRWTSNYRLSLEKDYKIENSKVLEKVEESHTQCRRLILKLAVDKSHRAKYMSEQYLTDLNRLTKESKAYILEIITSLELHTGPSALEKISTEKEMDFSNSDDLSVQLLLDYTQPEITSDTLLKYLDDLGPSFNSQPTSALTSCLLPFDTMSEGSDASEQSDSECESSEEDGDSVKSMPDTSSKTDNISEEAMDLI
ncbi:hypothetical protein JTE90_014509 [Oedothorax gibbosus]|uniref:Uncharacterized protein n=1 Tax=Oedothorax gibbosus TaxID=931172 RepID=A0AAV6VJN1_9ARAC|nr:hypothetical protein JTE90_014509 [Oedothorax gibbosus]